MQQLGANANTLYEDGGYFGSSEAAFNVDESTSASCATFLGLDECLDRHLKSSGLPSLNEVNTNGDSIIGQEQMQQHLDFELDDNGQLLHDMLQQHHHQEGQLSEGQQQTSAHLTSPSQQQCAAVASWKESIHVLQEMLLHQQHQGLQCSTNIVNDHPSPSFPSSIFPNNTSMPNAKFPGESELLSLLQLPRCASSAIPTSVDGRKLQMSSNSNVIDPSLVNYHISSFDYDTQQLLQHQQQSASLPYNPVALKHLFHNLPQTHATNGSTISSTMVHHLGGEDKEQHTTYNTSIDEGRQFASPIFDFKRVDNTKGEPRGINHFATERQRREYLNEKYQTLRGLVPNPTKADRASIVQDAIEYVKELKRTVQELQLLVQEKKRAQHAAAAAHVVHHVSSAGSTASCCANKKKMKLMSSEAESCNCIMHVGGDVEPSSAHSRVGEGLLRSSLLQRTSQYGTHVDVRIVEEEVNIKLVQKRRKLLLASNNSSNNLNTTTNITNTNHHTSLHTPPSPHSTSPLLLDIFSALHDLHLDLLGANGATIGDHHIFRLNTKIMDGSSTYAGQVATKLIEVVDRPLCNNYLTSY